MTERTSLLRLLIEEADLEDFRRYEESVRAAGLPREELEHLEQEIVRALQLRAILDERRRREREFAALYETAGDLTRFRDVETVLQTIVRRARYLLNADTAYITLHDEEAAEIHMRVSDGTISLGFSDIRLALGSGIGGYVAQNNRPYYTENYLADSRFVHTSDVDSVVEMEGLVAILGVPLTLGNEVIGVLFAADRSQRQFTVQDVTLLSMFGAHAAVALENARLFQEAQEAVEELNRANATIRAHSQSVERAADAHARLTALVAEGGHLTDVAAAVGEVFGASLTVVDQAGRVLAHGGPVVDEFDRIAREGGEAALSAAAPLFDAMLRSGRHGHAVHVDLPDSGLAARWVAPVRAGEQQLGALVLAADADLGEIDLRTLERSGQVTALLLFNRRSIEEERRRVANELIAMLASPTQADDDEHVRELSKLVGLDLDEPYLVIAALIGSDYTKLTTAVASSLNSETRWVVGTRGEEIVILVPGDDAEAAIASVKRRFRSASDAPISAGVSGPAVGPQELAATFQEARHCLRALLALGREGQICALRNLGIYGLLISGAHPEGVASFIAHTLGGVLNSSETRAAELLSTLDAYFEADGRAAQAADELHIHVNTLYQRLDRITGLTGLNWRDAEDRLQLQLAARFRRLQGSG